MAKEILTRCGYRCDLCHAYVENIKKDDQRSLLSEGWNKIFSIDLKPEEIYCEGCLTCLSKPNIIDKNCDVRACVISKGIENCAQCDDFPCKILESRIVRYDDWKEKVDFKLTRTDRKNFIKPYENYDRLIAIREAYPSNSRMFNKNMVPDLEAMRSFLGSKKITDKWDELHAYINEHYVFDDVIKYGGKNYGWVINYRKGSKSIINIHPERRSFTVLLVYGKKELEKIEMIQERLSQSMLNQIESAHQFHDGKWVWSRVVEDTNMEDFKVLIGIKRKVEKPL